MKAIAICAGLFGVVCFGHAQQLPLLKSSDWKPPKTSLPPDFVDAVRDLLGNGMADPRGGSFHKVKVLAGDATFPQLSPLEGYGWIIPGNKKVVCVDGLVYELVQDLGAARLEDVFMTSAIPINLPYTSLRLNGPNAVLEALLLVTGRTDLISQEFVSSKEFLGSLFLVLRESLQMQTAQNVMVKRDKEAYSYAENLYLSGLVRQKYSPLLKDFSHLFANSSEERIFTGMLLRFNKLKLDDDIARIGSERIRKLISRLDEVQVQDRSGLGALEFNNDPGVKQLLAEGEAVVPYLFNVIEKDKRLTRSVRVLKRNSSTREIVTVSDLASWCLVKVWPDAKTLAKKRTIGPELIPMLREAWKKSTSSRQAVPTPASPIQRTAPHQILTP